MNEQAKKQCDWPGCGSYMMKKRDTSFSQALERTNTKIWWECPNAGGHGVLSIEGIGEDYCTVPKCTGIMVLELGRKEKSCTNTDQHGELEKPKPFNAERMQAELDACKDLSRIGSMQVPREYCHRLLVTYAVEKERADKAEAELEVKQQKVIRQKKELAFLNGRVDEYIDNYKYECRKTLKLKADYAVLHGVLQKLHEIVAHNEPPGRDLPLEWIMEEAQKLLASPHPGADMLAKAKKHDEMVAKEVPVFRYLEMEELVEELRERVAALEKAIDDILHSSPCRHDEDYHRVPRYYMRTLNLLINGGEPIKETPSQELARRASVRMVEQSLTYGQAVEYVLKTQPALAKAYREFTLKGIVKNE